MIRRIRKTRYACGGTGSGAFTLIELLTVITIIMLLAGMLMPSVAHIMRSARSATTQARISALENGILQYYQDNDNLYPGQDGMWGLKGSQRLAYAMFTEKGKDHGNSNYFPKSAYVTYEDGFLANIKGRNDSISDGYRPPNAICYYPSRPGQTGLGQYVFGDNSVYTGSDQNAFEKFIKDNRFGESNQPYKNGAFLLIAPGTDGKYFTQDDIKNW